jgi:hypothetical protein
VTGEKRIYQISKDSKAEEERSHVEHVLCQVSSFGIYWGEKRRMVSLFLSFDARFCNFVYGIVVPLLGLGPL